MRRLALFCLLALGLPWAPPEASAAMGSAGTMAGGAAVASLQADATENDLYTSFQVTGAFTEEIREQISTGLPVTFTYYLEVARRRFLWFDKTLVRKTISNTVSFDTLTHQYHLSRKVNEEVTESSVAVNEADMAKWMTRLDRVRLADPAALGGAADGSLYIRVKSRLQKRYLLFFIPWDFETGWEKVRLAASGRP